ncbi:MAG TPA: hypothetical protein VFY93_19045 [Planctomycetota bacterium]|nr:hypothetical protein [Planctomycetota bacterium]
MHGSVLQNKKYISFAEDNTVEVLSLSSLEDGIAKQDKRAATYKAKGADGQEREFMISWPNLTLDDIKALHGSKAGTYNSTGKIPYTAVVDPFTLEEVGNLKGGYSVGALTELVTEQKKLLEKAHGKGVSRKTLNKVKAAEAEIQGLLSEGNLAKALTESAALQKKVAKEPAAILELAGKANAAALEAAGKKLDEIEAMIGRGDKAEAGKELGPLSRALKGTALEERALALIEQTKAE